MREGAGGKGEAKKKDGSLSRRGEMARARDVISRAACAARG